MLLELGLLFLRDKRVERRHPLLFGRPQQRRLADIRNGKVERDWRAPKPRRVGGSIGDEDDRRLQPLGAVHRHHTHGIRRRGWIALDLDVAGRKPGEETLERRYLVPLEMERAGHELVDGVARREAQPGVKFAPSIHWAGQDGFQEARRWREVGDPQQVSKRLVRRNECRSRYCPRPKLRPQRTLPVIGQVQQLLLAPADQRRDQQVREVEIVERLNGKGHRCQQVAHRERLGKVQPVDPGHRNALCEQAGDNQRRQLPAAANEDEDIAGRQRPPGAVEHWRLIQPALDLFGQTVGVDPPLLANPALLAIIILAGIEDEGRQQLDRARSGRMMRPMLVRPVRQAHYRGADLIDYRIDRLEDRRRRAEAGVDRQVAEL